ELPVLHSAGSLASAVSANSPELQSFQSLDASACERVASSPSSPGRPSLPSVAAPPPQPTAPASATASITRVRRRHTSGPRAPHRSVALGSLLPMSLRFISGSHPGGARGARPEPPWLEPGAPRRTTLHLERESKPS